MLQYLVKRTDEMEVIREFVPEFDQAYICAKSNPCERESLAYKECYPFEVQEEKRNMGEIRKSFQIKSKKNMILINTKTNYKQYTHITIV